MTYEDLINYKKMDSGGVIFLRWINYAELYQQYIDKTYDDTTFNEVKFRVQVDNLIKQKYGTDSTSDRYIIRSANGQEVVAHTTNVHGFNGTLTKETAPLCDYCRVNLAEAGISRPFPVINSRTVEVVYEKKFVSKSGKTVTTPVTRRVYSGDILCCDGKCAITVASKREYSNTNMAMYTRELFCYMYPDSPHVKAYNPTQYRLLKHNGGDMTYEEFKADSNSEFRELTNMIVAPSKRIVIAI